MMPAFEETFDLMGYDIVYLNTENDTLKNELCSYDQKNGWKNLKQSH